MLRLIVVRIFETYFRHRFLYLLPIIFMTIAAIAFYFLSDPVYISEGVVFVRKESFLASLTSLRGDSNFPWMTAAQETTDEFSEILQTDAFIRSIIEKTDLEAAMNQGPEQVKQLMELVRENVVVSSIGNNQIHILASHEDPFVAEQLANATIDTFLIWKVNANLNESQAAQDFLTQLVTQYEADLNEERQVLDEYLINHPEPLRGDRPEIDQLQIERMQAEIGLAAERYLSALDKDENARLAATQAENEIRLTYFLIDAPVVPDKPGTSLKETAVNMILFVIVGVIISGIAIAGATLLDRSVRSPIDVHQMLNLPVLTEVPDVTPKNSFWRRSRKPQQNSAI